MQELADDLGMVKSSVWRILTEDLLMVYMCPNFITKLLTDEQGNCRVEITKDNLEMINNDENLLLKVIIGDGIMGLQL